MTVKMHVYIINFYGCSLWLNKKKNVNFKDDESAEIYAFCHALFVL